MKIVFQKVVEGKVKYPPYMSANAVDIVKRLLDPNPETRLGCHKAGVMEIREHPFFTKEINFQLLIRQREEAPVCSSSSPPPSPFIVHGVWSKVRTYYGKQQKLTIQDTFTLGLLYVGGVALTSRKSSQKIP